MSAAALLIAALTAGPQQTVVVLDLRNLGQNAGVSDDAALQVSGTVRNAVTQDGRYLVVSRDRMNEIIAEHEFQLSDACDTSKCYAEVGGAMGAELMITGDVGALGDTYSITLRLIDIESATDKTSVTLRVEDRVDHLLAAAEDATVSLLDGAGDEGFEWEWAAVGAVLLGTGIAVDAAPNDTHLDAVDFVPVGLYVAGAVAIGLALF